MPGVFGEFIDEKDTLDFAQALSVTRNYLGSRLFPDRKTQFLQGEYSRLCKNGNLPTIAQVHGFDTEAVIGDRVSFETVDVEKLLIKEKINQTEAIRELNANTTPDDVKRYVFDDMARLAEAVIARVEKAKMDAIAKGKFTIEENNLKMDIDYGVPEENFVTATWNDEADILGDIIKWRDQAEENGMAPSTAITSRKVLRTIQHNEKIQKQIFGNESTGRIPTINDVNALLLDQAGISLVINEDHYGDPKVEGGALTISRERFFPQDAFVMIATGINGALGAGLWGVTPEEREQGAWTAAREQQFVTLRQWATPDPVAVWTKASGLFVPVMPNVYGHMIATITMTNNYMGDGVKVEAPEALG